MNLGLLLIQINIAHDQFHYTIWESKWFRSLKQPKYSKIRSEESESGDELAEPVSSTNIKGVSKR